ncbi:MAG: carboxypeptidase regulatory-like domain-containing protein [Aureispira sp.]|nr:carboxypeptidase regulatory-like domain-containing protein [Aureispira sp.]
MRLVTLCLSLLLGYAMQAQTIRGTIVDEKGEFLSGVQVTIPDVGYPIQGATTNNEGYFVIKVKGAEEGKPQKAKLIATFGKRKFELDEKFQHRKHYRLNITLGKRKKDNTHTFKIEG